MTTPPIPPACPETLAPTGMGVWAGWWMRYVAEALGLFKSFSGGESLVPAGQPGRGAALWKGAPEAVRGGYKRRFRYPNKSPGYPE